MGARRPANPSDAIGRVQLQPKWAYSEPQRGEAITPTIPCLNPSGTHEHHSYMSTPIPLSDSGFVGELADGLIVNCRRHGNVAIAS